MNKLKTNTNTQKNKRMILKTRHYFSCVLLLICTSSSIAQNVLSRDDIKPIEQWVEYRHTVYNGKPILLHLRTGHERLILMPEPVKLATDALNAIDFDVEVQKEIIGFYPKRHFQRQSIKFTGIDSGTLYELRVRSSDLGIRQPIQIASGKAQAAE